jgi:hypothetical protein
LEFLRTIAQWRKRFPQPASGNCTEILLTASTCDDIADVNNYFAFENTAKVVKRKRRGVTGHGVWRENI